MENIQVGQTWVKRNGEQVVVTNIAPEDPMPVKVGQACWQSNGRYWADNFDSRNDLVRLLEI